MPPDRAFPEARICSEENEPLVGVEFLDRNSIRGLVHAFYDDVRVDDLLGPVFANTIKGDWSAHLDRMVEFWCTVMIGTRTFKGDVYGKHVRLAQESQTSPGHFLRWLTLWHRHTTARFTPALAAEFQVTAHRIGRNLFFGFFGEFALFHVEDNEVIGYEVDPSAPVPGH